MLVNKLKETQHGEPIVVNKYENLHTELMIDNYDNLPRIKSSSKGSKCIGSACAPHEWKHRKCIKEGLSDNACVFKYFSNNCNSIRIVHNVIITNDVENKVLGMKYCEDNVPKHTTIFINSKSKVH